MAGLTEQQLAQYEEDGYVILRGLFDAEEVAQLRRVARADKAMQDEAIVRRDAAGHETRLTVRNDLTGDLYSTIVQCERMVRPMEQILGGEVYHYHHKMTLKEPRVGGAWEWHQDYGYWYDNGCLFPLLASCMIAVDEATRENGCLQVLKGSHHLGRIEHGVTGEQTGADLERVEQAEKHCARVYCTLSPGDALIFHCNLLHRSDHNASDQPRWSLICCYNAARNDPYKKHHHPNYTPMAVLPDAAVKEAG